MQMLSYLRIFVKNTEIMDEYTEYILSYIRRKKPIVLCPLSGLPWNFIWEPKPYSKEKHDEIAKKYNIPPKSYQPSLEEMCVADYPNLPMKGPEAHDPYYPYDIPTYRKNYHEIIHTNFELMGADRYAFGYNYRIDPGIATLIFVAFLVVSASIYILVDSSPVFQPVAEKQYPYKGKVYYTFEPAK